MIENSEQLLYKYIWEKLYCEKTSLFYDYLISENGEDTVNATPTPELVRLQIPNPCGYSTGMEDSALNGGIMLDAAISAFEVSELEKYAGDAVRIYDGLRLCAQGHPYCGYIARSVSPHDGKSVYINSSRDQYTNWFFGAYRYYKSGIASDEHRLSIENAFVDVAKKLEREVTEENDFELMRADGKVGIVQKMWGDVEPHEFLRMPMMYLAAFYVSGDTHWRDKYLALRDEAIEESFKIDCSKLWHAYCALQMQYSIRLLYELESEKEYKEKYKLLIEKVASYYVPLFDSMCKAVTEEKSTVSLNARFCRWDTLVARYRGTIDGYAYFSPAQPKDAVDCFYALRDIGNSATVIALADGMATEEILKSLKSVMSKIDIDNHYTGGPLDLWAAYWRLKKELS